MVGNEIEAGWDYRDTHQRNSRTSRKTPGPTARPNRPGPPRHVKVRKVRPPRNKRSPRVGGMQRCNKYLQKYTPVPVKALGGRSLLRMANSRRASTQDVVATNTDGMRQVAFNGTPHMSLSITLHRSGNLPTPTPLDLGEGAIPLRKVAASSRVPSRVRRRHVCLAP